MEFINRLMSWLRRTEYYGIDKQAMVQLRIQTFVDGKFRQAVNNIFIPSHRKKEAIKILLDAAYKLKKLREK